ncbi:MAG: T9SS type A sorting domain-containing protein, partial [Saprospiraceae bacterium]|nr:T9SS type A sorting domain-containing protein [Saprospiraceae bacterium]
MRISCLVLLLIGMYSHSAVTQCLVDSIEIKSLLIDPTGSSFNFDTNGDGLINSQDEYVEICNTSNSAVDLSSWQLGDDDSGAYPDYVFPDSTSIPPGGCLMIVNDYCPTIDHPASCDTPVEVMSMDLNNTALLGNSGDVVTLSNADGSVSCSIVYGSVECAEVDPLDIPPFDMTTCQDWGSDTDGCPLLMSGDSCTYLPVALPVVLEMFEVQRIENEAYLKWITGIEVNNDRFEIEWSPDATLFEMIEIVEGAGNSSAAVNYSYVHTNPVHGDNYYRLKQIDLNGEYAYSGIRHVQIEKFDDPVIAPNRTADMFRILGLSDVADVSIYNLQGNLIIRRSGIYENRPIDISGLNSGMY